MTASGLYPFHCKGTISESPLSIFGLEQREETKKCRPCACDGVWGKVRLCQKSQRTAREDEGLVSVIVPVYCVEDRLRRCVDSILNQTLRDLEVILVDDGSPDGCGAICDEYADRDSRVRVIHKANGGLSSARNAGLEVCRGEYVAFVDSDDWLEADMLQLLLDSCLQYGAQIAECGYRSIYSDRTEDSCPDDGEVLQADGLRAVKGLLEWTDFSTVAWNKLYLYNVIKNIRYPEGKLHEDEFTTYRIFLQAEKLVFVRRIKYNYDRTREGSITSGPFSLRQLDACEAAQRRRDALHQLAANQQVSESASNSYCWVLLDRLYAGWKAGMQQQPSMQNLLEQAKREAEYYRSHPVAPVYRRQLEFLSQKGLDAFGKRRDTGWQGEEDPPGLWSRLLTRLRRGK